MRNGDDDHTTTPRFWQRKQLIAGTAGLAIVFGGSVALTRYFVTDEASNGSQGGTGTAAAVSPGATPSAAATTAGPTGAAQPPAAAVKPSPPAPRPTSKAQRIAAARAAVKKAGPTVNRAVPQARSDEPMTVRTYGSQRQGNYLKVVSARTDLSRQKELAWPADDGHAVGEARCTQKFAFANTMAPAVRPTLLVCWRTTAARSVYTVAVVRSGRPSEQRSVSMLAEAWTKLG